tara:strand:+ start:3520 stop:4428 length:909 start_codon:yes stop_codon:yes gene_type:complete
MIRSINTNLIQPSIFNFNKIINITDVTVRDGLQSYNKNLNARDRSTIVDYISELGISDIEVGSLVSDKIIPQMSNSIDVFKLCINKNPNLNYHMLVANNNKINDIIDNKIKHISFITSPSESFNKKNINCSVEDSIKNINNMIDKINYESYIKVYFSCIGGCPYEGEVPLYKIIYTLSQFNKPKINELCLSDTLGTLKYEYLDYLLKNMDQDIINKLSIHLHQIQGSNEWKKIVDLCLEYDIRSFDTSLLNLGGCPAAFSKEKKSGNLNLFDFVDYLDSINEPHLIIKDKIKDIENKIQNLI